MTEQPLNPHSAAFSVVVISYNTASLTLECLARVLQTESLPVHIIVVDNNSSDTTISRLRKKYGLEKREKRQWMLPDEEKEKVSEVWFGSVGSHNITVLCSKTNLGFGAANNLAAKYSPAGEFLFLNSDAFLEPDSLVLLRSKLKREKKVGIFAGQLLNQDGSKQKQGGALPTLAKIMGWFWFLDDLPFVRRFGMSYQLHDDEYARLVKKPVAVLGWVSGAVMAVRRELFLELGGFDENIFMYAEDVDLCWRAREAGALSALVPMGRIVHLGSASSGSKNALHGEIVGILYLWKKHSPRWQYPLVKGVMTIGLWMRVLLFGILRQYGRQRIYREALELVR